MLTTEEEDQLAKKLSNLTPIEYSQLMAKVKREPWKMISYRWNFTKQKPEAK
jgi:hypothetical protein